MSEDQPLRVTDPLRADRLTGSGRQVASPRPSVAAGWNEAVDLAKAPAGVPEPADTPVPDELRARIEELMPKYPDRRSAVIPALWAAQQIHGWCSPEAMEQVAAVMRLTPAAVAEIATFYDMFRTEPVGSQYVYVCTSVACHLSGARAVFEAIKEAGSDLEGQVEIREFECLGACDMAPMASCDGRYIGPLDTSDAAEIVAAIRESRTPLPGRGLEDEDFVPPGTGVAGAADGGGARAARDGGSGA